MASLPLTEILPSVSFASSIVSVLGGVTLIGFLLSLLNKKYGVRQHNNLLPISAIGLLFLFWILFTDPTSAINPDPFGRIWIITFFQLWLFSLLTALLFDSFEKIEILMWFFVVAAIISAIFAVSQGEMGSDISSSERAEGLVGGANSAARYFIIAFTFLYYLQNRQNLRIVKLLLIVGGVVVFLGVLLTVSRSGLLLLAGSIGLLISQNSNSKNKMLATILILLSLGAVWFFADNLVSIFKGIFPSIIEGSDTVGMRYALWHAGFLMWLGHPITGVGIGGFSQNLHIYGWDLLPIRYLHAGAHNMYVAVLSETGIIGLLLFMTLFILTLQALLKAKRSNEARISELAGNWFIVTILVLLGGITKHDHYDKSTWIVLGIGGAFVFINRRLEKMETKILTNAHNEVGH